MSVDNLSRENAIAATVAGDDQDSSEHWRHLFFNVDRLCWN